MFHRFLLVCCLLSIVSNAQTDAYSYDKHGRPCKKEDAAFYRTVPQLIDGLHRFTEYYLDDKIKTTGSYKTLDSLVLTEGVREGYFISYDTLGLKISEGSYTDDYKSSTWKYYYSGANQLWYVEEYTGKSEGVLQSYYPSGKLKRSEMFAAMQPSKGKCFDEQGKQIEFTPFLVLPQFPGGESARNEFLAKNIIYPEIARENNLQGRVTVRFVVYEDGTINDIAVVKAPHILLAAEAMRVVSLMPKWKPGMQDDKPAKVSFTLPIRFALE